MPLRDLAEYANPAIVETLLTLDDFWQLWMGMPEFVLFEASTNLTSRLYAEIEIW